MMALENHHLAIVIKTTHLGKNHKYDDKIVE
jgi:hypothetical protein